jgi:hypothetical protein
MRFVSHTASVSGSPSVLHLHDIDAWRAALRMIQHYGRHALRRALAHIYNLRKDGGAVGAMTWFLIAEAIMELTRDRRHDEPLN